MNKYVQSKIKISNESGNLTSPVPVLIWRFGHFHSAEPERFNGPWKGSSGCGMMFSYLFINVGRNTCSSWWKNNNPWWVVLLGEFPKWFVAIWLCTYSVYNHQMKPTWDCLTSRVQQGVATKQQRLEMTSIYKSLNYRHEVLMQLILATNYEYH